MSVLYMSRDSFAPASTDTEGMLRFQTTTVLSYDISLLVSNATLHQVHLQHVM